MLVSRPALVLVALTLAATLCSAARAQDAQPPLVRSARIMEYGIYSSDVDAFIVDRDVADNCKILSQRFRLVRETDVIPARLGLGFGFQYVVAGEPKGAAVDVDVVVEHPPLFNPKLGQTYLFSRTAFQRFLGEPGHAVWSFDEGWTLCPGTWTIRIEYQGRLLAKKSFTVTLAR